eukprot:4164395-Pleurochrysis_carterae.AAC.1
MIREQLLTQGHPAAEGEATSRADDRPLALINGVTGINHSRSARGHAIAVVRERDAVSAMGLHVRQGRKHRDWPALFRCDSEL